MSHVGNGIEKRILENRDVGEVNECMDAEGEPLLVSSLLSMSWVRFLIA